MKADLHIHSKTCSDGRLELPEIFREAHKRGIEVLSITDHDSIDCQESAGALASQYGMLYVPGVELSISFSHPDYRKGKPVSLDVLGYFYDIRNEEIHKKLEELREYRKFRAQRILEKINEELDKENRPPFTPEDLAAIEETVDGAFGRPHIANYMVRKGLVADKQEAFDRYLVKCNVPKLPLSLEEASGLIRGAGGLLALAHPNDPNGTSLATLTDSLEEQHRIIRQCMLPHLDGIECWHSRHDEKTVSSYLHLVHEEDLVATGGSDCHQQPILMGSVRIPDDVLESLLQYKEHLDIQRSS